MSSASKQSGTLRLRAAHYIVPIPEDGIPDRVIELIESLRRELDGEIYVSVYTSKHAFHIAKDFLWDNHRMQWVTSGRYYTDSWIEIKSEPIEPRESAYWPLADRPYWFGG